MPPWIHVQPTRGGYLVACRACGAQGLVYPAAARQFVAAHAAHRAAPGYVGVGDAVARLAKPVARAFGQADCTPCATP